MKAEKSTAYTLILGVCIILSLLLLGRMLLHKAELPQQDTVPDAEAPMEEDAMTKTLTEDDVSALILQALPLRPDALTAQIGKDGTIAVSALISKQALGSLVSGNMRTALLFLPDPCKLYGAWTAQAQDGTVVLTPQRAEVAGMEMKPESMQRLTDALNQAVGTQLAAWELTVDDLSFEDGSLLLISKTA